MGINTKNGFIEFRHVKLKDNRIAPAITFIFDVNQVDNSFILSFAVCSDKDNFSREVGRTLAMERMKAGFHIDCEYDRDKSLVDNALFNIDLCLNDKKKFQNFVNGFKNNDLERIFNSIYIIQLINSMEDFDPDEEINTGCSHSCC